MVRHWRRLAFAASAAAAAALVCAVPLEAQAPTPAKKTKTSKAKAADQEQDDAAPKTPAKKKKQDPVEAQRAIEAALKLLETGKTEQAVQALSAALAGGNLPPAIMARALLYRGIAYRQQKKPAQAIADLTSALWLKGGLGESDRADALKQRASAYQEAGLSESGAVVAAVPTVQRNASQRTASTSANWGAATTPAPPPAASAPEPAPKASGNTWGIFGNLFGGPSASQPASTPRPPAPQTTASIVNAEPAAVAQPERRPQTGGAWSRNTHVRGDAPTAALEAPRKPEGRFRIQVGMVRTEAEARALAARVKGQGAVAAREPEIDQAVVGNMGSFYRIRVGPFATAQDGQAACASLKSGGLDCLVVTQ